MIGPQQDLFEAVKAIYANHDAISNPDLYDRLSTDNGVPKDAWKEKHPVGKKCEMHSLLRRKVRWIQQTLKKQGIIERDPAQRGYWKKTAQDEELTRTTSGAVLLGFSTNYGVALWADNTHVFKNFGEPIHLILTSPPYALSRARAYGNPTVAQYVDWLVRTLEPLVQNLLPGGTLALNCSNDVYKKGMPSRELLNERLLIALEDRLGLHLLDRLVWENPSKPPAPTVWACVKPYQLVQTWEPVFTFTNDPSKCLANNRRVLRPHTEKHQRLISSGGETRHGSFGDGAYRIAPGSFKNETEGAIPRNVLRISHTSGELQEVRKLARSLGLPTHGALMPLDLASILVRYLCPEDGLVADPFGGWGTSGMAAEMHQRKWVVTEQMREYVAGMSLRFKHLKGYLASQGLEEYLQACDQTPH